MTIHEDNFIYRLRKRDEKALDYVIETYGWLIKTIVKKHLYNLEHLQGECVNDILLAVWHHINDYKEERNSFKSWLGAVSKYKCIDYKRKYLKLKEVLNLEDMNLQGENDVETEIMKNELSADLESLLNHLKKEDRDLFIKHYVEDKDIDIISKEMNKKPSVIYNRLSRGRSRLKNIFSSRLNQK